MNLIDFHFLSFLGAVLGHVVQIEGYHAEFLIYLMSNDPV